MPAHDPPTDAVPLWRRYLRFWRPDIGADVDDELGFHLDMRAAEYEARGLPPAEARRRAQARFGDVAAIGAALRAHDHRTTHRQRRRESMGDLRQDLRLALRGLRRAPGFAAVAVLTLALGIGANSAIFSVVNAVLLRPLPYQEPDRLVRVSDWGYTGGEFVRLRELSRSFQQVAAFVSASHGLSGDGEPERLDGAVASANLFATLGASTLLGRAFAPGEDEPGRDAVVVLSHGLWQRRYGSDPGIVGRSVTVDGALRTVVGVMPRDFHFPSHATQLWIPLTLDRANLGALWGSGGYTFIARLRPGVTVDQARADVRRVAREIRRENPIWDPGPEYGSTADVMPLQRSIVGAVRPTLLLLLGVVGCVLLIACVNVANLLLVRTTARQQELAIRTALGGGRGRLLRQLLTESVVLAIIGGIAGLLLAWPAVRALVALLPADMPRVAEIGLDWRVLAFTALLTLLTGVAFGLLPALRATGGALHASLKAGGRGGSRGAGHHRLSSALVAGEIALAVVLVSAAGLLVRSFQELRRVDPGFRTERVIAARISPPKQRYADAARQRAFYTGLLQRVAALPGVESAAAVNQLPLRGGVYGLAIRVEGKFEDMRRTLPMADHYQIVTPGYLQTMGIPLLRGRWFTDADREGAPDVVVVSESMARHFWPGEDPIGRRIGYPWPSEWLTVVGVAGDVKQDSLSGAAGMTVYRPLFQAPASAMTLVARTTADPVALAAGLRAAVAEADPDVPVSDVSTMAQVVAASVAKPRFTMFLLAAFAAVALALGAVGIYGVMSYAVSLRTREIGVRMALGATPRDALGMVVRQGALLTAAGVGVGVVGALAATRVLAGLLYGVTPTDPLTFVAVPVVLAAIALAATYLPARRATQVDPTVALRAE